MKGIFTISLDFELHWGGFEKWPLDQYQTYFLNTRQVIPEMLNLFQQYGVHVTWATVGILFHDSYASLKSSIPAQQPGYRVRALSAYAYMENPGIGVNESDDPFHYAASLVKKIIATPHQELASHTFAHYYCNEEGQTLEQFREDLKAAQRTATALYGKSLHSLVFPRNQFNEDYLRICREEGFSNVRDNPRDWFWNIRSTQNESIWKRFNRGLDAYFPVGKKNTYTLDSISFQQELPVCIPASRLLRPYNPREFFLNSMKISRIKSEMERAARKQEVYHLWWHPHNFGRYPKESLAGLEKILQHFDTCRKNHGMATLSMGEIADLIKRSHAA